MTTSASTNAVAWAVDTARGPAVHERQADVRNEDTDASPLSVDAVVTVPDQNVSGPVLAGTESTTRQGPDRRTLLRAGLNQPAAPTARRYVLPVAPMRETPYTFQLLQQWEGTVTELADVEFTAELRDLTDPTNYREEAAFDLDEVSPDDRQLLALGAVFRWSIGYRTSAAGQRERVSHLRFVRIPGWRRSVVAEIEQQAAKLQEQFPLA